MKTGMLTWLAIILSVSIVILFLLPLVLDLNRFRARYLPVLEQAFQRPVGVQDVRLTLFPRLGFRLLGLTIADDPAVSSAPFITIPSAEVVVQWKSLLHRSLQIDHVRLNNPVVHLIRTRDGMLNAATIGKTPYLQSETSPGEQFSQPKNFRPPLMALFAVEQFTLTGGTLTYEDQSREQSRTYFLEKLKIETRSFRMGQTADIRINGIVMPLGLPIQLQGQMGPLQPTADIPEIQAEGKLGKIEATAQGTVREGKLELDVQIPRVSSKDLPQDWALAEPLELHHLQAHLIALLFPDEEMPLFSEVTVNPLTFELHFNKSIIHVSGEGSLEQLMVRGTSPAVCIPISVLPDSPPGSIVLERLVVETEFQGDGIQLRSLNAQVFEGNFEAHGEWKGASSVPRMVFEGHFTQFAVEPVLREAFPSSPGLTGTGELYWKIEGIWPSSTQADLRGPIRLWIRDGTLKGFDLVQSIEEALQLPGLLGKPTIAEKFSLMEVSGDLQEDRLDIRQLILKAPDFSVDGTGQIGGNQDLQLQGNLALSPALSDRIMQNFPMAKAVRQQGQLVLPFVVQGSVQEPVLQFDFKSMGNQVKKNLEQRLKKVLQGDEQELQQMLQDGKEIWKQLFKK